MNNESKLNAIIQIYNNPRSFFNLPEYARNEKDIASIALSAFWSTSEYGLVVENLGHKLRDDLEFMSTVIYHGYDYLQFCSDRIKDDIPSIIHFRSCMYYMVKDHLSPRLNALIAEHINVDTDGDYNFTEVADFLENYYEKEQLALSLEEALPKHTTTKTKKVKI